MTSIFADHDHESYPHRFAGTLHVGIVAGGIPSDPKTAEEWILSKISDTDDRIRQLVAETMLARGITADEAAVEVDQLKHLNGFDRDEHGLYLGLRNFMAMLKEGASVAMAVGQINMRGWGLTKKNIKGFLVEHIVPVQDRFYLGVNEPSGVAQHFPHTFNGNGIQYVEYVTDAKIDFELKCDYDFDDAFWRALWTKAENQGIGAMRSQGYGRFQVVRWERAS